MAKKKDSKPPKSAPAGATLLLDALLKATGEPAPKADESLKDFCYRIFLKIPALEDDVFSALPEDLRKWYDKNTDLFNSEQFDKLEALPGMPGAQAPAATETTSPAAQAAPPKAPATSPAPAAAAQPPTTPSTQEKDMKGKKGKKGSKPAAKKPAATGAPTERAPRTDSLAYKIRSAVVKKPSISFEDACAAAGVKKAEASSSSHAFNYYNHARVVLSMFMEHRKIDK